MVSSRTFFFALIAVLGILLAPPIGHFARGHFSYDDLPAEEKTDAIMVFSGTSERLAEGYDLYLQGLTKKLMITGNDYPILAKAPEVRKIVQKIRRQKDKVFIDLTAENTIENAESGAEWAIANNVKSILLVTSEGHMQRAFFELRRLLPDDIEIYTHTVPGAYNVAALDSEQAALLCRVYETAINADFCFQARDILLRDEDSKNKS